MQGVLGSPATDVFERAQGWLPDVLMGDGQDPGRSGVRGVWVCLHSLHQPGHLLGEDDFKH